MGSRERKRADRRKRKERSGDRREELAAQREERAARTEAKNQAAREELDPLEPDERPGIVTVAAVISALLVLGTLITYIAGVEVNTFDDFGTKTGATKPNIFATVASSLVLGAMAYGLWRSRYWAVLGFQTILGIQIVFFSLYLIGVQKLWQAIIPVVAIGLLGWLFWKLVRPMAQLQMAQRAPGDQAS